MLSLRTRYLVRVFCIASYFLLLLLRLLYSSLRIIRVLLFVVRMRVFLLVVD